MSESKSQADTAEARRIALWLINDGALSLGKGRLFTLAFRKQFPTAFDNDIRLAFGLAAGINNKHRVSYASRIARDALADILLTGTRH